MTNREMRELELRAMMQRDYSKLVELYMKAAGVPFGTMPPIGMLASQMIQVILEKEFPEKPPQ